MPRAFITRDGFGITPAARAYLAPLIAGEDYPPYRDGVPRYARPQQQARPAQAQGALRRLGP